MIVCAPSLHAVLRIKSGECELNYVALNVLKYTQGFIVYISCEVNTVTTVTLREPLQKQIDTLSFSRLLILHSL